MKTSLRRPSPPLLVISVLLSGCISCVHPATKTSLYLAPEPVKAETPNAQTAELLIDFPDSVLTEKFTRVFDDTYITIGRFKQIFRDDIKRQLKERSISAPDQTTKDTANRVEISEIFFTSDFKFGIPLPFIGKSLFPSKYYCVMTIKFKITTAYGHVIHEGKLTTTNSLSDTQDSEKELFLSTVSIAENNFVDMLTGNLQDYERVNR